MTTVRLVLTTAILALLASCGDPLEHHIAQLIEDGAGVEEAKIELNMAKGTAIVPLIAAFRNPTHPPRARVALADALYKLYLREADDGVLSARLVEGKAEAYLGYVDQTLYIGIKGYEEPSTAGLVAKYTQRDADVWRDDCIEIFISPAHDYKTYYQLMVNSLGVLKDGYNDGSGTHRFGDTAWSADFPLAASVEDQSWSVEIAIPAAFLHDSKISAGDVWGLNLGRTRIGNASEYGQWVPTYGFAHRPERFGFLVFE